MPGLGFAEMLFIFVAALLLFGPRRLPELGRTLGKGLAEFRRASAELRRTLDAEGLEQDLRETRETIRSVDPRRYVKEALMSDQAVGRVARGSQAAPAASDPESAPADDALVRDPMADEASADDPAVSDSSIGDAAPDADPPDGKPPVANAESADEAATAQAANLEP